MSTFSYQTPVQFWWKWILYKLTLVSQSVWPLPRVPLNQGGPPCSSPAWPPGPRQGWAPGSNRFWLLELPVSRTFLDQLLPQLIKPRIPSSARGIDGGPNNRGAWEGSGHGGMLRATVRLYRLIVPLVQCSTFPKARSS